MTRKKTGVGVHHTSDAEKFIIEDGVSLSQLSRIFRRDKRTIATAIRGLIPVGERLGYPIYDLGEAAGRLAVPDESRIIDQIKRLKPTQLPIKIQKEFWDAARSRQKYLEDQHELWRTQDIVNALLEVFKSFKQGCNLMADAVDRETELTSKQRVIINELTDALLIGVQKALFEDSAFAKLSNVFGRDHNDDDLERLFDQIDLSDDNDDFLDL